MPQVLSLIAENGLANKRLSTTSTNPSLALGHVRLAILDLSTTGAQPFHNLSNTVHAVVNGELYDYDRIRASLEARGYTFRGTSDCEIVIYLYQEHGISLLQHLRGEFSLCLYDSERNFFFAARDRYGVKPLFWTVQQGRLLVAAEMKAFLPLGWKPRWDVRSVMDGGWRTDQRTSFEGVQTVRPGEYLTCQSGGNVETRTYWDIEFPDKRVLETRSEQELIELVRAELVESVRIRLRADVPVGVYLSGGIDSSVLAGIVTHLVKERGQQVGNEKETDRVSCFSIAFDEDTGFDESDISNRTADWLGVKFHKKHMGEAALAEHFEDATWHAEHQNPDMNYVGKYCLSTVPLEHGFKVVLTGEGADEIFAGYSLFLPDYLQEADPAWPQTALSDTDRQQKYAEIEAATKKFYEDEGAGTVNRADSVPRRMLNNITTASSLAGFVADVYAPWTASLGAIDAQLTLANMPDGRVRDLMATKWHPLNSGLYLTAKANMANIFLSCLGDRSEMAHSIEARPPFLDHHFTAMVNNLPPSMKMRYLPEEDRFVEKWILREASRPFITDELYRRKKHPYSAPTTYAEGGPLHRKMQELVSEESVEELGFVSWEKCGDLVRKAFVENDPTAMRMCFVVAQWVVLGRRFGVEKAGPASREAEGVSA